MYNYKTERPNLFTEEGVDSYIEIRDRALSLLKAAGAFTLENAIKGTCGDSWLHLACVDRMVEKGIIKEIKCSDYSAAQYRLFVKK